MCLKMLYMPHDHIVVTTPLSGMSMTKSVACVLLFPYFVVPVTVGDI